jgi:hypothetical protein
MISLIVNNGNKANKNDCKANQFAQEIQMGKIRLGRKISKKELACNRWSISTQTLIGIN